MNRRDFLKNAATALSASALALLPTHETGTEVEQHFDEIHDIATMKPRVTLQVIYPQMHDVHNVDGKILRINDGEVTYPLHNNDGTLTDDFKELLKRGENGEDVIPELYQRRIEDFSQSPTLRIFTQRASTYEVSTDLMAEMLRNNNLSPLHADEFDRMDIHWAATPNRFLADYPHVVINLNEAKPTITFASETVVMKEPVGEIIPKIQDNNFGVYAYTASHIFTESPEHFAGFTLPLGIKASKDESKWEDQFVWESTVSEPLPGSVMLHPPMEMLPQSERPEYTVDIESPFKRYAKYHSELSAVQSNWPIEKSLNLVP